MGKRTPNCNGCGVFQTKENTYTNPNRMMDASCRECKRKRNRENRDPVQGRENYETKTTRIPPCEEFNCENVNICKMGKMVCKAYWKYAGLLRYGKPSEPSKRYYRMTFPHPVTEQEKWLVKEYLSDKRTIKWTADKLGLAVATVRGMI